MIDVSAMGKVRKVLLWTGVSGAAFFGIVAVISLIVSTVSFEKPMQYRKVVPDVKLKPGERKVLEFESFCLDNHRGSPGSGVAYSLLDTPATRLRPYLRGIFDEYLSYPSRWKQSDVQQAVWYTEGHKKWETLSGDQRRLIVSATGKEDPVSGNPVVLLGRMTSAFGTVVKTNLLLALMVLGLVVLTLPSPLTVIERGISWMAGPRFVRKLSDSRFGQGLKALADNKDLSTVRAHVDVLFTRLVFRMFSRRR